jgi:hypothetical protein
VFHLTHFKILISILNPTKIKFAIGTSIYMTVTSRAISFFLILLSCTFHVFAQEDKKPKDYIIEGKVTIEGNKPAAEGAILVGKLGLSGGSRTSIAADGTYSIKLDFNKEYTLTYTKKGYVSQVYQINTQVEKERIEETFINKEIYVELFQMVDGVNVDLMKQPVAKILYDEMLYDFDEEENYTASMKPQIEELKAKLLAQKELNKNNILTAEELAKQKAEEAAKAKAEEAARIAAEKEKALADAKAKKEADALAKLEEANRLAAEKAKVAEEAQARKEAAEKAKADEAARLAADKEKARLEALAKKEAEDKAKAEEAAKLAADKEKARLEAQAKKEAEDKAKAEEAAKLAADKEKARLEAQAKKEAEDKAKAEEAAKLAADKEKARLEAQAKKEAEDKAKAEEAAKLAADKEKARLEAQAKKEAEDKAKAEAIEKAKLDAAEATRLAAEAEKQKAADLAKKRAEEFAALKSQAEKKAYEDEIKRKEALAKQEELYKNKQATFKPVMGIYTTTTTVINGKQAYGYINFGNGIGNQDLTKEEYDDYQERFVKKP